MAAHTEGLKGDALHRALVADIQRGDRGAETRLIETVEGYVWGMARKLASRRMPPHDLAQCGFMGLLQAARRFKLDSPVLFLSFAGHRIHGAMIDACRGNCDVIKVPRTAKRDFGTFEFSRMERSRPGWRENVLEFATPEPGVELDLKPLLRTLCDRDRLIMLLWMRDERMKAIGEQLGLSESRVSQLVASSLIRLRENLASNRKLREAI